MSNGRPSSAPATSVVAPARARRECATNPQGVAQAFVPAGFVFAGSEAGATSGDCPFRLSFPWTSAAYPEEFTDA
ncbi:MAG: hypothetical protein IPL39_19435 [Opitutaceae bacterium]|nr:hypothetical protein [Opitutaceae bacterium]